MSALQLAEASTRPEVKARVILESSLARGIQEYYRSDKNPLNQKVLVRIEERLQSGAPVDEEDSEGYTLLHKAAKQGDLPLVTLLLRHGADVHRISKNNRLNLLQLAHQSPNEEIKAKILDLLKPKASLTALLSHIYLDLKRNLTRSELGEIEDKLKKGEFKIEEREPRWLSTPIMFAAQKGDLSAVKLFLKYKADLHTTTHTDPPTTVMQFAEQSKNPELIALLKLKATPVEGIIHILTVNKRHLNPTELEMIDESLKKSELDVNAVDPASKDTLIFLAAKQGDLALVEKLFKHGADIHKINKSDEHNLLSLVYLNTDFLYKMALLESLKTKASITEWLTHIYLDEKRNLTARELKFLENKLKAGHDVNERDARWDTTPIMFSAQKGDIYTTQLFLKYGADVHTQGFGRTVLSYAEESKNPEVIHLIQEAQKKQ